MKYNIVWLRRDLRLHDNAALYHALKSDLAVLPLFIFEAITPFLFTTHMIVWRNLFEYNMPLDTIYWSIGVMLAHIVLFTLIALYHFNKKDISS